MQIIAIAMYINNIKQSISLFLKCLKIVKRCDLHFLSYFIALKLAWNQPFPSFFQATARKMAPTSKYVAVVAIDFGTTYSGFAFSFNDRRGEGGIHMNREWGIEEGRSTLKTPTSILLCPNKKFDSFGYEADDKYAHFTRGEEKEYFYLKHFKMELHKSKVTNIVRVSVKVRHDCMLRCDITSITISI